MKKIEKMLAACLILTFSLTTLTVVKAQIYVGSIPCTYMIFQAGSITYAQNCNSSTLLLSSTIAYAVFQDALGNMTTGGNLFVRAGTYTIANSIYVFGLKNIIIQGAGWGTILKAGTNIVSALKTSHCNNMIPIICVSYGTGITVQNMELYGNAPNQNQMGTPPNQYTGIMAEFSSQIVFQNLFVNNFKTLGIWFTGVVDSWILDNYINDVGANGITLYTYQTSISRYDIVRGNTINNTKDIGVSIFAADSLIDGNTIVNMNPSASPFNAATREGILVGDNSNASRIQITDNHVENKLGWAIEVVPSSSTAANYDILVQGNRILDSSGGIYVQKTKGVTISGNLYQSTPTLTSSNRGIWLYTGTMDANVNSNTISDTIDSGIVSQANAATISANTIIMTARAGSNTAAIYVSANNNTISDNLIDESAVAGNMRGILLNPGQYGNIAIGNTITGNPSNTNTFNGIAVGGTKVEVIGNTIGGFNTCISSLSPINGLIQSNIVSTSTCATKIAGMGNSTVIMNNQGYNPFGTRANFVYTGGSGAGDGTYFSPYGSTSTLTRSTTYTIEVMPCTITFITVGTGVSFSLNRGIGFSPSIGESFTVYPGQTVNFGSFSVAPTLQVTFQ